MNSGKIPISNRLGCALVDFFVTVIVIGFPTTIVQRILNMSSGDFFQGNKSTGSDTAFVYIAFFILLNKDIFNGQSFIKGLFGFQVVDRKAGIAASDFKCFIRNTTMFLWPLEVIVLLFSTDRRLGDIIAGTKIISVEKKTFAQWFTEVKNKKFSISTLMTIFIAIIYLVIISSIINLIV